MFDKSQYTKATWKEQPCIVPNIIKEELKKFQKMLRKDKQFAKDMPPFEKEVYIIFYGDKKRQWQIVNILDIVIKED